VQTVHFVDPEMEGEATTFEIFRRKTSPRPSRTSTDYLRADTATTSRTSPLAKGFLNAFTGCFAGPPSQRVASLPGNGGKGPGTSRTRENPSIAALHRATAVPRGFPGSCPEALVNWLNAPDSTHALGQSRDGPPPSTCVQFIPG